MPNTTHPNVLIMRLRFHGDVLLTTPVLSAFKQRYPDAQVDYLVYRDTAAIIAENPLIRHIYCVTKGHTSVFSQIKELIGLLKILRKNKYDLILNLTEQWPIALLSNLLGAHSIAFDRDTRLFFFWRKCFSTLVNGSKKHAVERNLSILQPLGITEHFPLSLCYRNLHWLSVQEKAPSLKADRPYVVIQPSARQFFKCWDDAKFALVIDHLMQLGLQAVVTSGPAQADIDVVEHISTLCQNRPITALAGNTSLLELAAVIDHASLFIGVDSAPMHMAAALHTPIVCLFGATNYRYWRPWSDNYILLWAGDYHPMPERKDLNRQFRYLSYIPAYDVIQAADELLANNLQQKPTGE